MTEISSRRLTDVMRINFRLLRMQHLPHSVLFPWGTYSNIPTGIPRLGKNQKARFSWPISARLSNVNNLTVKWVIALSGNVSWSRETDDEAPCISECSHDVPQRYAETNTTEFLILVVPYQTLAVSQGDLTNRTKNSDFREISGLASMTAGGGGCLSLQTDNETPRISELNLVYESQALLVCRREETYHNLNLIMHTGKSEAEVTNASQLFGIFLPRDAIAWITWQRRFDVDSNFLSYPAFLLPCQWYNFTQNAISSSVGGSDYLPQISSKSVQCSCGAK